MSNWYMRSTIPLRVQIPRFSGENRFINNHKTMMTDVYQRHNTEDNSLDLCVRRNRGRLQSEWPTMWGRSWRMNGGFVRMQRWQRHPRLKKDNVQSVADFFREWWKIHGGCWRYRIKKKKKTRQNFRESSLIHWILQIWNQSQRRYKLSRFHS